ncbi:hypothetical protein KR51_00033480 [Rubidibacter lacunae KORDI 51-2]|uniref:Uncharacterized protein n=1 Tax=Rubidibacter lacunae KORDI 51-2 TaxID=582515 RepID=U5D5Z0_9CHRO|nr:hypothetical protein KR51_00033480 [Rubidibacter lacunae KORDI 51-2]
MDRYFSPEMLEPASRLILFIQTIYWPFANLCAHSPLTIGYSEELRDCGVTAAEGFFLPCQPKV